VREQAVVADRHAEAEQDVRHDHDREVDAVDPAVPEQHHGSEEPRNGTTTPIRFRGALRPVIPSGS
jgi:hypothetical protein